MCSRVTGRREQHCVHQTEHRGVRAYAEGEHENGSNGKAGRLHKLTASELKILDHISNEMRAEGETDSTIGER